VAAPSNCLSLLASLGGDSRVSRCWRVAGSYRLRSVDFPVVVSLPSRRCSWGLPFCVVFVCRSTLCYRFVSQMCRRWAILCCVVLVLAISFFSVCYSKGFGA